MSDICSPSVDFIDFPQLNHGSFRVSGVSCATSTGDFLYTVDFSDGSVLIEARARSWTAADSSSNFEYQFDLGSLGGRTAVLVRDIRDIRCTCV